MPRPRPRVDVFIKDEGTIVLFNPVTRAARLWLEENVQSDATWFGPGLVVEHRYARDLAFALVENDFQVSQRGRVWQPGVVS